MQRAVLFSFAFHLTLLLVMVFGVPSLNERREIAPPIPVQLVALSQEDMPAPPKPEPKPAKVEKPKPPEPEPLKEQTKLPEPAPAPEPAPRAEPEPQAVVPPPEPEPVPPEPETKPELAEESPPPPTPKPKPQIKVATPEPPKDEKPPEDRLTTILRNVDKLRERQTATAEPTEQAPEPEPEPRGSRIQLMNLARSIQQQMSSCWRIEPGARDAEDLVVEVRVTLRRDGSVGGVRFVDQLRVASDAFYRSAAENARRAIIDCAPFELPLKDYEVWREMRLTFDPKFMFGG